MRGGTVVADVLERVGVPDDDGDSYVRIGLELADMEANYGPAPSETRTPYGDTHTIYKRLGHLSLDTPEDEYRGREVKLPFRAGSEHHYLHREQVTEAERQRLGRVSLYPRGRLQ
jgi:hypothetical protein